MSLNALTAISPVDGRYHAKTVTLSAYFSEFALIKYRVRVEVEYFIALTEEGLKPLPPLSEQKKEALRQMVTTFSMADAERVKEFEKTTNHDVKSVEYFIKEKMEALGLSAVTEFIHFGLTSQDINNTAIPLLLKEATTEVLLPALEGVMEQLYELAHEWKDVPMLALTHGQPASPTRLGKELTVFVYRLKNQLDTLKQVPMAAKFGGATGNFNAHTVAFPDRNWHDFGNRFVQNYLGLERSAFTTQIENYDFLAAYFDGWKRLNTILIDACRDIWQYVSMGYFKQKINKNEVGSSAMPHKVNPIDFENAEGNLGIANALFEHLAAKLPISRLQRDLTDSTVLRNVGVPLAHSLISLQSVQKGLSKLQLDRSKVEADLHQNWAVVAEAIQTVLRREGFPKPYEALKELTRTNQAITERSMRAFIDQLAVSEAIKEELKAISPFNYVGQYPA